MRKSNAPKGVPSQKDGWDSNVYTPNPKKPHIERFKQSRTNDDLGITGRVANPVREPTARGALEKDVMRKGQPVEAAYDGGTKAKMKQGLDQFGEGLKMAFRGGKSRKK